MDINACVKRKYENDVRFEGPKNKANLLAFSVLRSADSVRMRKSNLKKQSQFVAWPNGDKRLCQKGI